MAIASHAYIGHLDLVSFDSSLVEILNHTMIVCCVRTRFSCKEYVRYLGDIWRCMDGIVSSTI